VHCEGSDYASNNNHVANSCCLAAGATYTLSCKDSRGDGWDGGYMTIGNDNFCSDFSSGSLKTEEFVGGNLPAPSAVTTADPTPESLATTAVSECETDVIQLYTGEYASEVSWTIFAGSNVHCEGSDYASTYNHVAISCCLAAGATYALSCKDSYGDGWNGGYLTIGKDNFCSDFSSGSLQTEEFVGGNLPVKAAAASCEDDASYVDPTYGDTCSGWMDWFAVTGGDARGHWIGCSDYLDDVPDLEQRCPVTCGACTGPAPTPDSSCSDVHGARPLGYPCSEWASWVDGGLVCQDYGQEIVDECRKSCKAC
jgi:hypothetical protein